MFWLTPNTFNTMISELTFKIKNTSKFLYTITYSTISFLCLLSNCCIATYSAIAPWIAMLSVWLSMLKFVYVKIESSLTFSVYLLYLTGLFFPPFFTEKYSPIWCWLTWMHVSICTVSHSFFYPLSVRILLLFPFTLPQTSPFPLSFFLLQAWQ